MLTIGNFDGVHVGHRALLDRCRELAEGEGKLRGAVAGAVTFDRPPVALLNPVAIPPQLTTLAERVDRLKRAGAQFVEVLETTPELLGLTAEAFVERLVERLRPVAVVEGPDFRFGKGRAGDLTLLEALGRRHGFSVHIVEPTRVTLHDLWDVPVSSSLCRWLVGRGRVGDAARCLGRPFELTGTIVRGEQRGRSLGFPTANLDPEALAGRIVPLDGVYAGTAVVGGSIDIRKQPFAAAISVGVKPTFAGRRLTVEAHLLDLTTDDPDALYGRPVTLRFHRWVRDQYPFPTVELLRQQLQRDLQATRELREAAVG